MTTIYQAKNFKRIPKPSFVFCTSLKGNPQVKGRYIKMVIITPRKPNSAMRKVGRVQLVNKKKVFTKVAGSGNYPQKFATVLVKGHGYKDTPSVKYQIQRGKYDCITFFDKLKKRSRYGILNPFLIRKRKRKKKNVSTKFFNFIIIYLYFSIFIILDVNLIFYIFFKKR